MGLRMLIFGIVASGKTTLAQKLSSEFKIPYYEGDCIAWGFSGEKRYKRSDAEQNNIIKNIDNKGDWIIEGTYRESQKCLFDMAETIVYLDTPIDTRIYRIIVRFVKQKLGIEKCNYKSTFHMLKMMFKWTYDYEKNRNKYEKMLLLHEGRLLWVKSEKELRNKLQIM